jgi:hypothetical protein
VAPRAGEPEGGTVNQLRVLLGGALVGLLAGCSGGASVAVTSTAPQDDAGVGPGATATATPTAQISDGPSVTPTAVGSVSSGTAVSTNTEPIDWPASATPAPVGGAKLVVPRPGMLDVHPVPWAYLEQRSAYYYAGVEPCVVLDSVKVDYRKDTIAISLFTGSDPEQQGRMCMALARATAVDVTLADPPAGRAYIDGSTGKAPTATTKPMGM